MRWLTPVACLCLVLAAAVAQAQTAPAPPNVDEAPEALTRAGTAEAAPAPAEAENEGEAGMPAPEPRPAEGAAGADDLALSADADMGLTMAELEALDLSEQDGGVDTSLMLSGFMDVTVFTPLEPGSATAEGALGGSETSFMVGSINLYLQKYFSATLRTMAEIRFLYLPNGYEFGLAGTGATNTRRSDYLSPSEDVKWGSIEIERAYLDWMPDPLFAIRLGQFLTPYGIWNVDHGSPVVLAVVRPYAVSGTFMPERQTGVQIYGRWDPVTDATFGYHLTLSNGTGPITEYRDLDANKAIGGRLYGQYHGFGHLTVGVSGYRGRDTAAQPQIALQGGAVGVNYEIESQADITGMAADLLWKLEGLQLQAEWVGRRVQHTDVGRVSVPVAGVLGVPAGGVYADSLDWSCYGLVGYRLPWLGIMPFATVEYMEQAYSGLDIHLAWSQVGINMRPIPEVVLKAELVKSWSGSGLIGEPLLILGQVAWVL